MLLVEGSSDTGLFRKLSKQVFRSPEVQKYISYTGHLFFENVQNWIYVSEMQERIEKKFFVSEIIASEDIAITCLY